MCGVFGTSPCGGGAAWKDIHTCTVECYTEASVGINKAKCFEPIPPSCDPVGVNPISGQLIAMGVEGHWLPLRLALLAAAAAAALLMHNTPNTTYGHGYTNMPVCKRL